MYSVDVFGSSGGTDTGVADLNFFIELSDLNGSQNLPNSRGGGRANVIFDDALAGTIDPAALMNLINCAVNAPVDCKDPIGFLSQGPSAFLYLLRRTPASTYMAAKAGSRSQSRPPNRPALHCAALPSRPSSDFQSVSANQSD